MFVACVLAIGLGARPCVQDVDAAHTLAHFLEGFGNAETTLQIDRGEVIYQKNKSRAKRTLSNDLKAMATLVAGYEANGLPPISGDSKSSQATSQLDSALRELLKNIDDVQVESAKDAKSSSTADLRKVWYAHGACFRKVLLSALKFPGFDQSMLSAPVAYNLGPVLFDVEESVIYADSSDPSRAKVADTFGGKKASVQKGDQVIAYRRDDEDPWTSVQTWRDLLHVKSEGDNEEEGMQQIFLRIRRGGQVREVKIGFVASPIYTD